MKHINWSYTESGVDKQLIVKFENDHNVIFPPDYVNLLCVSNGASPDKAIFSIGDDEFAVNYFLSWSSESDVSIISAYDHLAKEHSAKIIPFANDAFGNLICFNFEKGKENPTIEFWYHEQDQFFFLANDFTTFMNSLQ